MAFCNLEANGGSRSWGRILGSSGPITHSTRGGVARRFLQRAKIVMRKLGQSEWDKACGVRTLTDVSSETRIGPSR